MRLIVNENIAATVIQGLRQRGHDVLSVKESMRSEPEHREIWPRRICCVENRFRFRTLAAQIHWPNSTSRSISSSKRGSIFRSK